MVEKMDDENEVDLQELISTYSGPVSKISMADPDPCLSFHRYQEDHYKVGLVFEGTLDVTEDEEGKKIPGLEVQENTFCRESGDCLPEDLQPGDKLIAPWIGDRLVDPDEAAWHAKHEAERQRIIATAPTPAIRNMLLQELEQNRACTGDTSGAMKEEPEPGLPYAAPQAPSRPRTVEIKTGRLSINEMKARRVLLTLAGKIRAAIAQRQPTATIGALLREAKVAAGHGQFSSWLERETGLTARTAQRYMGS